MKRISSSLILIALVLAGCEEKPKYGQESTFYLPGPQRLVVAVAPTLNLSGQKAVDPLLQSDLLFTELQEVHGITVIPVNRVAEIYASLRMQKIQSSDDAQRVCELLGCDGLVVPTVTLYEPYDPPKLGATLQLFLKPGAFGKMALLDTHDLDRSATISLPPVAAENQQLIQAVIMDDADDGSVRSRAQAYAQGRTDPNGPIGDRAVFISMDRYCGFVYHELIQQLLSQMPQSQVQHQPVAVAK